MTVSRDVRLNVIAETKRYQQEMAKIPGVTQREAARAAVKWEKELTKAAVASAKAQEKAAKEAAKAWEDFGTVAAVQLSVDALKASAQAVFEYTQDIMALRAEQINLSEATGIGLDTLAGIEVAAERAGIPVEQVTGAFEDFGEVLFDAANGSGRAKEALELLGFTNEDLNAGLKDTDAALRRAIEGMVAIEDQGKRNAVAQQLFGDAGNRLNAILGDGTLEDYIAVAEELGLVLDEEAVANTKAWTAATAELNQVVRGTANELLDFVEIGRRVSDVTLGFVAVKEFLEVFTEETLGAMGKQLEGIALILTGDFREGLAVLQEGVGLDALSDALETAQLAAAAAAASLLETRQATEDVGNATQDTSKDIADLSDNQEKAAKAAAKAAKAEEKLAKERRKAANELISALFAVQDISARANEDQLSDFEKIAVAQQDQIDQVREVERVLGVTGETRQALRDINERAARDEAEFFRQLNEDSMALAVEFDELDAQLKEEQRARLLRNIQVAQQGFNNLASAASDLLGIQLANAEEAGQATADRLSEELAQREELAEAIAEASTEEERAALERDAAIVESRIGRSERILEEQRKQTTSLFNAQKGLEIASITMSAASAVIAALAPPPVGLGPVFGGLLSATVAAAAGAQVAVVASQQPPQFHAGFSGFTRGSDERAATITANESVNNSRMTDALGGPGAVQEANQTGNLPGRQMVTVLEVGGRQFGMAVSEEMDAGRELTQSMNRRMGRRVGVRPVYQVR